jgi:hypothetical protein
MFTKGSRYRNLPQSSSLTAAGERLQGVDLRVIPKRPGAFLHTVQDSDRLDLLAYKYYGDSTKWWQISDANPAAAFPIDLVDFSPLAERQMQLSHADSSNRYQALSAALGGIGLVAMEEHDFIEGVVVMTYDGKPATRQQILGAIKGNSFNFLSSFQWNEGPGSAEAFVFDDQKAKAAWRALLDGLRQLAGVLAVGSVLSEATINLVFNRAMVADQAIVNLIASKGFTHDLPQIDSTRTGKPIVVPPNRIG